MGLNPRSSWPKSKWQRHYTCERCGGALVKTCELQFDSGSVEPTVGETLTGATSADTGVVVSVSLESGTWAGGDAVGTVRMSSPTGEGDDGACFSDNETVNGSTGGTNILTANNAGIVKTDGIPYPEGETGLYRGKRYCTQHLDFMISQEKYTYRISSED